MYCENVIVTNLILSFKNLQNHFARRNTDWRSCGIRNSISLKRVPRQTRAGELAGKNFDVRSERTGIIQPNQSKHWMHWSLVPILIIVYGRLYTISLSKQGVTAALQTRAIKTSEHWLQ